MKKRKCDHCSEIATKSIYCPKNDYYRIVCNNHAKEIIENMRNDGWNINAEKLT